MKKLILVFALSVAFPFVLDAGCLELFQQQWNAAQDQHTEDIQNCENNFMVTNGAWCIYEADLALEAAENAAIDTYNACCGENPC